MLGGQLLIWSRRKWQSGEGCERALGRIRLSGTARIFGIKFTFRTRGSEESGV